MGQFKLQIQVAGHWISANTQLKSRIPENCDALAWVREQYPASSWRIAWVRDSQVVVEVNDHVTDEDGITESIPILVVPEEDPSGIRRFEGDGKYPPCFDELSDEEATVFGDSQVFEFYCMGCGARASAPNPHAERARRRLCLDCETKFQAGK